MKPVNYRAPRRPLLGVPPQSRSACRLQAGFSPFALAALAGVLLVPAAQAQQRPTFLPSQEQDSLYVQAGPGYDDPAPPTPTAPPQPSYQSYQSQSGGQDYAGQSYGGQQETGRPSFLRPPTAQGTPAGDAETIMTQVEVPIPAATAEPLGYPSQGYPAQQGRGDISGRIRVPAADAGTVTMPLDNRYQATEVVQVRRDPNPITPVPGTGIIDDNNISPSIIYGPEQEALPQQELPDPGPPPPDYDRMIRSRQFGDVESAAVEGNDSGLAAAMGWARYREGQNELAYQWFERALSWDENNYEAAYGLALTLYRMGRYSQAEEVARWRAAQYPKMNKILGDITARRAVNTFQGKNYRQTRDTLLNIRRHRALTREEQIMLAWSEFHLGNLNAAGKEFVRLYRARPDRYAAEGVFAVYSRARDWTGLETIVVEVGGPLEGLYLRHVSQKYLDYGLHRYAYREAPSRFRELKNISTPSAGLQVIGRSRSGTEGTSQLSEYGVRFNGTIFEDHVNRFDISIGVTSLDSGALVDRETRVGTYKDSDTRYRYMPRTNYDGLVDARVRWERQGLLTPMIELGITPINGEINPTFIGKLGLRKAEDWGYWEGLVYRDPVKDSLLSYTGMRDPYTGKKWGRVTETGGRFALFGQLQDNWGFYGSAGAGVLMGSGVPNNAHAALALAVSKTFEMKGFEYLTVGPSIGLEFYNKNLSHFTFGQGGYFSPKSMLQGMIGGRFLTKQGGTSLLRGNAGVGIQTNRQAATPLFPNKPDGRWHSATTSSGVAVGLDLEGLYMLSDQWVLGGALAVNVAPDYNDFSVRLSLQYFFDRRGGLFAQDFLTF